MYRDEDIKIVGNHTILYYRSVSLSKCKIQKCTIFFLFLIPNNGFWLSSPMNSCSSFMLDFISWICRDRSININRQRTSINSHAKYPSFHKRFQTQVVLSVNYKS